MAGAPRGQGTGVGSILRWHQARMLWQAYELLGMEMLRHAWRIEVTVRNPIVDRSQARGPEIAKPACLHRRRFACEGQKPIEARVSGQIDEDVDLRFSDGRGERFIDP